MDPTALLKALLMHAAAVNAASVCATAAGDDGQLAVDPLIADTEIRDKGVMVYEEAKIQYHALLRAYHDKTGIWPDPKVPASAPAAALGWPAVVSQAIALLGKLPRETPTGTIGQLLDLLAAPSPVPTQPGQELKP